MMPEISTKFFLNSELIFLTAISLLSHVYGGAEPQLFFSSLSVFSHPFLHPGSWYTFIIFLSQSSQSLCLPTQYLKKNTCLITKSIAHSFQITMFPVQEKQTSSDRNQSQCQVSGKGAYLTGDGKLFLPVRFFVLFSFTFGDLNQFCNMCFSSQLLIQAIF